MSLWLAVRLVQEAAARPIEELVLSLVMTTEAVIFFFIEVATRTWMQCLQRSLGEIQTPGYLLVRRCLTSVAAYVPL